MFSSTVTKIDFELHDFVQLIPPKKSKLIYVCIHSSKIEFYDKLNAKNQLKMQKLQILENLNMSKSILETQF
jgi:flagellum-specific peptidoglycan hydrolase FlgJ